MSATVAPEREIYTVSRLNQAARVLLESGFALLWVEGEVSNLARPASGHLYFSLKDTHAQVRCAMFRTRAQLLREPLTNGRRVLLRARVSLYEARGDFQLTVEHAEAAGEGELRRRFDELQARLAAEGLFDAVLKRPLPRFPRRIGVITSPSGAAVRDVLTTLGRRYSGVPVLVYPTPVQGEGAVPGIVAALVTAARRGDCDVLLLVRGGGALEDLWAFNEERVARAIRACPIPVVCGVGHETDVTIADLAADLRGATPTAAAELASPLADEWRTRVHTAARRLALAAARRLVQCQQRLDGTQRRLERQSPQRRLLERAQRLDELDARLRQAVGRCRERAHARLAAALQRLLTQSPARRLSTDRWRLALAQRRLALVVTRELNGRRQRLMTAARALQTVSPLATLARGYAIVRTVDDGRVLRDSADVAPGTRIEARLSRGRLLCRVEGATPD